MRPREKAPALVKVLVAVKQVARLVEDTLVGARPEPAALAWELNDWDGFSMEAAVGLVEEQGEGEVVAVSVGATTSEEGLRACLAKGADRAVRVWGDALESPSDGLDPGDPLVVATVLAALVRREGPDVIVCGAQSSDAAHAATGIALAGLLDLPHAAVVRSARRDGQRLVVEREIEGGAIELLGVALPALITVQTGPKPPRHPNFRALREARAKPLEVCGIEQLDLDATDLLEAAGYRLTRMTPPEAPAVELLEGEPAALAARILEILERELHA